MIALEGYISRDQGDARAQYSLGIVYSTGIVTEKDYKQAVLRCKSDSSGVSGEE